MKNKVNEMHSFVTRAFVCKHNDITSGKVLDFPDRTLEEVEKMLEKDNDWLVLRIVESKVKTRVKVKNTF